MAKRNAMYYAERDFPVFPCFPNSKKSLTLNEHLDATTDWELIDYWWSRCPNANIAIHTQNLVVLDIDVKSGVNGFKTLQKLEKQYGKLPTTRTQKTPSGGQHRIFKTSNLIVPSLVNCPGEGLDIRARDGYILADPSSIDGISYKMNDARIEEAPVWLLNHIYAFKDTEDKYRYP